MPRVEAWECPHTGKLFPINQKVVYKRHLAKLSRERTKARQLEKERIEFEEFLSDGKKDLDSPNKIAKWVEENYQRLYNYYTWDWVDRKSFVPLESVQLKVVYSENCGGFWNTPSRLPESFPGLRGKVKYILPRGIGSCPNVTLNAIGIYTGSGGGNAGKYGYSTVLCIDEWPALAESVREQLVLAKLRGEKFNSAKGPTVKWVD